MKYEVYIIKNSVTSKVYIGVTSRGINLRFREHLNSYDNGLTTDFSKAINRIGKEKFYVELLETCDETNFKDREIFYIQKYSANDVNFGYNVTEGGDANPMHLAHIRKKQKAATNTPEFKEFQRKKGLAFRHTQEAKDLVRQRNLASPEKFVPQLLAYNNSKKISVYMLDPETEEVLNRFESLSEAADFLGKNKVDGAGITSRIDQYNKNGKRKKFWGYYWSKCE